MNLYFLLEGSETEVIVLPAWLDHLLPDYKQVYSMDEVNQNNYFIISGFGNPGFLNYLKPSMDDINEHGHIDYFIVLLDSENETIEDIHELIKLRLKADNLSLENNTKLKVIVADKCIETWFLGNKKMCPRHSISDKLKEYYAHFDVKENDPEKMDKPKDFRYSVAQYHMKYLKSIFAEREITYKKNSPGDVTKPSYLNQLILRTNEGHLPSLKTFLEFCASL